MKKSIFVMAASMAIFGAVSTSQAQNKIVKKDTQKKQSQDATSKSLGSATTMDSTKSIVDNTSNLPNYTILVSAVKASGLLDTLKGEGSFTLFAPSNEAFTKLPKGTIDIASPEGKNQLAHIAKYHIVSGNLTSRDLALAVSRGKGKAILTTVSGEPLVISINAEKNLQITDENGGVALVTKFDASQSNGVIHAINTVLIPENE